MIYGKEKVYIDTKHPYMYIGNCPIVRDSNGDILSEVKVYIPDDIDVSNRQPYMIFIEESNDEVRDVLAKVYVDRSILPIHNKPNGNDISNDKKIVLNIANPNNGISSMFICHSYLEEVDTKFYEQFGLNNPVKSAIPYLKVSTSIGDSKYKAIYSTLTKQEQLSVYNQLFNS